MERETPRPSVTVGALVFLLVASVAAYIAVLVALTG